jgi:hypothetical protein
MNEQAIALSYSQPTSEQHKIKAGGAVAWGAAGGKGAGRGGGGRWGGGGAPPKVATVAPTGDLVPTSSARGTSSVLKVLTTQA